MKPDKILWLLGYSNLTLILEQERNHWLMKTDKNKQVQDKVTGDLFQGKVDNIGTDVIIEAKKLPYKFDFTNDIKFGLINADKILDIRKSAFPHSEEVNGLMMSIVTSINYPITDDPSEHHTYKLRFENAVECVIPFGVSDETEGIFATHWLKTTTTPKLVISDSQGTRDLEFTQSVTNPVWYYPLDETLQPFGLNDLGGGTYETRVVDNNNYIGYPLFWFTCDNSAVGTNVTFTNNTNGTLHVSNNGNDSPYNGFIFTGLTENCTPDGNPNTDYVIKVSPKTGSFNDSSSDMSVDLSTNIVFKNTTNDNEYTIGINFSNEANNYIRMNQSVGWEYVDANTYQISMGVFDVNYVDQAILVPMLDVTFSSSVPFVKTTSDEGMSGIKASASITNENRYPYNMNLMSGLPTWMQTISSTGAAPEHLAIYAYHVPTSYDPLDPDSLQGAGLLVDPGLLPEPGDTPNTDNIGRVYVLSNDAPEYVNNDAPDIEYKKPARTAARICDIPTSIFDLNDANSTTGDPIVDKKYVRTEVCFYEADKYRLYNDLQSRWVRPTALNNGDTPICDLNPEFPGKFAFSGEDALHQVDMYNVKNNFREKTQLNPMVDVTKVSVGYITNGGSGYDIDDSGLCIVGGYSFRYRVTSVTGTTVNGCEIIFNNNEINDPELINISNFDSLDYETGQTVPYGTAKLDGNGTGLQFTLAIDRDYLDSIKPSLGEFFTNLFAFVRTDDGLYSYRFDINNASLEFPKPGVWIKDIKLAEYEGNSTDMDAGGLSTRNSYMNSIIPTVRLLPVAKSINDRHTTSVKVAQTATMLNVVDTSLTPVLPNNPASVIESDIENVVDICKYHAVMSGIVSLPYRTLDAVKEYLIEKNFVRYDCYILWRWVDITSTTSTRMEFAVVYRGLNNYQTTDTQTFLPGNELRCKNYVHTNENTTIVWNNPVVGPMTWVYDPCYTKKETYYIDPETMELHVIRTDMTFNDIDVTGLREPIVGTDDRIRFNVLTNNPRSTNYQYDEDPIYQQPDLVTLIEYGQDVKTFNEYQKLFGNWRLAFPRVNSFTFESDLTATKWIPMNMQVIKGRNIAVGSDKRIFDENGNDVTTKNLVMTQVQDSSTGETTFELLAFDTATGVWVKI